MFVIDVSASTFDDSVGTTFGDLNGDGQANTIIDAGIAGFIALNNDLINRGLGIIARVAIVAFNSSAITLDLDPMTTGIQVATSPNADRDANVSRMWNKL